MWKGRTSTRKLLEKSTSSYRVKGKTESDGDVVKVDWRDLCMGQGMPHWTGSSQSGRLWWSWVLPKASVTKLTLASTTTRKRDLRTVVLWRWFHYGWKLRKHQVASWILRKRMDGCRTVCISIRTTRKHQILFQDIRVLNRIISWKDEGIWWEPDSRHGWPSSRNSWVEDGIRRTTRIKGQDTYSKTDSRWHGEGQGISNSRRSLSL